MRVGGAGRNREGCDAARLLMACRHRVCAYDAHHDSAQSTRWSYAARAECAGVCDVMRAQCAGNNSNYAITPVMSLLEAIWNKRNIKASFEELF